MTDTTQWAGHPRAFPHPSQAREDLTKLIQKLTAVANKQDFGDDTQRDASIENFENEYTSPGVALIVGPTRVRMMVHEAVLKRYPNSFSKLLQETRLASDETSRLTVATEKPEDVRILLSYLYGGGTLAFLGESPSLEAIIDCYIVAVRYSVQDMVRCAIDRAETVTRFAGDRENVNWSHFIQLENGRLRPSDMWSTLMVSLCTQLLDNCCDVGLRSVLDDGMGCDLAATVELLQVISDELKPVSKSVTPNVQTRNKDGWGDENSEPLEGWGVPESQRSLVISDTCQDKTTGAHLDSNNTPCPSCQHTNAGEPDSSWTNAASRQGWDDPNVQRQSAWTTNVHPRSGWGHMPY